MGPADHAAIVRVATALAANAASVATAAASTAAASLSDWSASGMIGETDIVSLGVSLFR